MKDFFNSLRFFFDLLYDLDFNIFYGNSNLSLIIWLKLVLCIIF